LGTDFALLRVQVGDLVVELDRVVEVAGGVLGEDRFLEELGGGGLGGRLSKGRESE
jgi:hypothetical protein